MIVLGRTRKCSDYDWVSDRVIDEDCATSHLHVPPCSGKCLDYEYNEDSFAGLFSRKDPREGGAR